MSEPARTVRIVVSGIVQGVGFRAWTRRTASGLGLSGWVRNRADGRVEAVVSGPPDAVAAMLVACRKGPAGARVDGLDIADEEGVETGPFEQRPTV